MITAEVMTRERIDSYIDEAARVAECQDGFGVSGCDLNSGNWWQYTRGSQAESRLKMIA